MSLLASHRRRSCLAAGVVFCILLSVGEGADGASVLPDRRLAPSTSALGVAAAVGDPRRALTGGDDDDDDNDAADDAADDADDADDDGAPSATPSARPSAWPTTMPSAQPTTNDMLIDGGGGDGLAAHLWVPQYFFTALWCAAFLAAGIAPLLLGLYPEADSMDGTLIDSGVIEALRLTLPFATIFLDMMQVASIAFLPAIGWDARWHWGFFQWWSWGLYWCVRRRLIPPSCSPPPRPPRLLSRGVPARRADLPRTGERRSNGEGEGGGKPTRLAAPLGAPRWWSRARARGMTTRR